MAASTWDSGVREFFRSDALEEFWHCDSFYFVDQAGARLVASDVKDYVPLPASTAFEDYALRVAEENPLGHLLIAYFQESSIIFGGDSEQFYHTVEANYGLEDAFAGWRKHMTLDMDHDHAGDLEARFDDEREITLAEAESAIRAVQLAHFFLLRALDQIVGHAEVGDALSLRLPSSIVRGVHVMAEQASGSLGQDAGAYLLGAMRDGAFRALVLARAHDQIVGAGRLASRLAHVPSAINSTAPDEPWLVACRNFLVERSIEPSMFVDLAGTLAGWISDRCPELRDQVSKVHVGGTNHVGGPDLKLTEIRLSELLELAASGERLTALIMAGT